MQIGSIVQLASGGPKMTVVDVTLDGVSCLWFAGDEIQNRPFKPETLRVVEGVFVAAPVSSEQKFEHTVTATLKSHCEVSPPEVPAYPIDTPKFWVPSLSEPEPEADIDLSSLWQSEPTFDELKALIAESMAFSSTKRHPPVDPAELSHKIEAWRAHVALPLEVYIPAITNTTEDYPRSHPLFRESTSRKAEILDMARKQLHPVNLFRSKGDVDELPRMSDDTQYPEVLIVDDDKVFLRAWVPRSAVAPLVGKGLFKAILNPGGISSRIAVSKAEGQTI